jgi:hypothetical protein
LLQNRKGEQRADAESNEDAYPPMPLQGVPEHLPMVTEEGEQDATTNQ